MSRAGWPENCPPESATAPAGVYYHFVRDDPPSEAVGDCLTGFECRGVNTCGYCALSVFTVLDDIRQFHAIMRKRNRRLAEKWRFIAWAVITEGHGVMELVDETVDTHTNWWPAEELPPAARCGLFRVLEKTESSPPRKGNP
jgi:hypothetical protein